MIGLIDLPIVIPHSAAGIAILGFISRDSILGEVAGLFGLNLVGHPIGIALAMAFVSIPFMINSARDGFEAVPVRLEKAALTLGASPLRVFFTISLPLAWRSILSGFVLMFGRGMSEFGAVVIVAYHPMITPVLIWERFSAFGLSYARPVSVLFIIICLLFFIGSKVLVCRKEKSVMLSVQNLTKKYDEFHLDNISLEIGQGEYFVLLGPSGAGKTVLFETIAGIIQPDSGRILFEGRDITHDPVRRRQIGLGVSGWRCVSPLTAGQNISYPLKIKNLTIKQIREKVFSLAEQMGITSLLHRKPSTLSGGELRRVAIARTLALDPKCLLLDEPLSSLDVQLQQDILDLLKNLNKGGLTILHITHNYREAFYLAHRMAVIDKGRIIQQGLPSEIVAHPKSKFVYAFIGIGSYAGFNSQPEG